MMTRPLPLELHNLQTLAAVAADKNSTVVLCSLSARKVDEVGQDRSLEGPPISKGTEMKIVVIDGTGLTGSKLVAATTQVSHA
jgi:hypothetical protein